MRRKDGVERKMQLGHKELNQLKKKFKEQKIKLISLVLQDLADDKIDFNTAVDKIADIVEKRL